MSKIAVFYFSAFPLLIQVIQKFCVWNLNMHHHCYKIM